MYQGERLNGYTHLAGSVLAVAGAVTLIDLATHRADPHARPGEGDPAEV